MSIQGRRQIIHLLHAVIRANRAAGLNMKSRDRLKGSLGIKTFVISRAQNYLAELQLDNKSVGRKFDPSRDQLKRLISTLRKSANDDILGDERLKAIERLMRIEGLCSPPIYDEPIDTLIGTLLPTNPEQPMALPPATAGVESLENMMARLRGANG